MEDPVCSPDGQCNFETDLAGAGGGGYTLRLNTEHLLYGVYLKISGYIFWCPAALVSFANVIATIYEPFEHIEHIAASAPLEHIAASAAK